MAKIINTYPSKELKDRLAGYAKHIVIFSCGHRGELYGTLTQAHNDKSKCQRCADKEDVANDALEKAKASKLKKTEKHDEQKETASHL